tara:strand:+ start:2043 stop:2906 length:864 start_codon:yes stop_codon:yes gene_type:complete
VSFPIIQWYPGHIAKAEKQLTKNLERIDLVIEIRDARIPKATSHPHLHKWIKGKKHLVVINRKDMINSLAIDYWKNWYKRNGINPIWCEAKGGHGTKQIWKAAVRAGYELNRKRESRGMRKRAVRALTLGFPNVGKSALINRLVGKKIVESSRKPGVTRDLRWIRLGEDLDLLDAPGVLPPKLDDQNAALRLAFCDDIGQAAYDAESVATSFLSLLIKLQSNPANGIQTSLIENKYGEELFNKKLKVYEWLKITAIRHTSGNTQRMAQRILDDFRKSSLGQISLEIQ